MKKFPARNCLAMSITASLFFTPLCAFATDNVTEEVLNINSASSDELELLEGVDHILAEKIILEQKAGGFFQSFADLEDRVEGVDKALTSEWLNAVVKIPAPPEEDNLDELEKELYRTQD